MLNMPLPFLFSNFYLNTYTFCLIKIAYHPEQMWVQILQTAAELDLSLAMALKYRSAKIPNHFDESNGLEVHHGKMTLSSIPIYGNVLDKLITFRH